MCRALLALAVVVLALGGAARADQESDQAAAVHFDAAEQHYLRGHYAQAIEEFQEAYRLSGRPELFYNIAQAYERMGDLRHAREYLKKYLDSGVASPEERPLLEDKLKVWDQRIAEEEARQQELAKPRARPFKTWKWVAGGTGAALLAASAFFVIDSARMSAKIEDAADQSPLLPFDGELVDAQARGKRDELLAIVTGVSGAAALGVGILFFALDEGDEGPRVTPTALAGGAGAQIFWRW